MESIKTLKKDLIFLYKIKEKLEDGVCPIELELKKGDRMFFTLKLPSGNYLYPKDDTVESVLEVIDKNIEIFQKLIAQYRNEQRKRNVLMNTIEEKINDIFKAGELFEITEYEVLDYIYEYLKEHNY